MYGITDSPLHRGLDTDRLVAIWELDSERVESRLTGGGGAPAFQEIDWALVPKVLPVDGGGPHPPPGAPVLGLSEPRVLVGVPRVIDTIMGKDLDLANRWREATRAVFTDYLPRGYQVTEFFRREAGSFYLLEALAGEGSEGGTPNGGAAGRDRTQ
jgi:predicted GNAT superfamily acetyltransferase